MKTIGLMKALALCGQYRNASPERRAAIYRNSGFGSW